MFSGNRVQESVTADLVTANYRFIVTELINCIPLLIFCVQFQRCTLHYA